MGIRLSRACGHGSPDSFLPVVPNAGRDHQSRRIRAPRIGVWLVRVLILAALIGGAAAVLAWARTRPGYDPYGWLVWGRQALHGRLDLGGAPSWKPLPFLFTLPYALTGSDELWLWMVTAIAVSLAGCLFGASIAYRIVSDMGSRSEGGGSVSRVTPAAAAVVAGFGVLEIQTYLHYILSVQSDPMITTFCLAAIDAHLRGRYRWALFFLALGSLGRPEVWPFLLLEALWCWARVPGIRYSPLVTLAVVAGLWFGVPWITNGRPNLAGELAMNTRQVLHSGQISGTLSLFAPLHDRSMWFAALVAVAIGVLRRQRAVLVLAGAVVLWVIVEIVFAYRSLPVLPRFMFEAGAVGGVLAGIGVGSMMTELSQLPVPMPGRRSAAAALAVVAAAALLVPVAIARVNGERTDLQQLHQRSRQLAQLESTINSLGGSAVVRGCGEPVTYVADASALAWLTHLNVGQIGYKPSREMRRRYPIVIFRPQALGGWSVQPWHVRATDRATCSRLRSGYLLPTTSVGLPARAPVSRHHAGARASSRRSRARSDCRSSRQTRSPGAGRSRCRRPRSRSRR
jgi:hypothetical protein